MIIIRQSKAVEFKDLFPKIDDFVKYLNEINYQVNLNNENFIVKLEKAYNHLIRTEGVIKFTRLSRYLGKAFEFESIRPFNIIYWLERGFSETNYREYLKKINQNGQKSKKTKRKELENIDFNGRDYVITFNSHEFITNVHPKCEYCSSELELEFFLRDQKEKQYRIIKCSNEKCETHQMTTYKKYQYYLPKEVNDKINQTLKQRNHLCVEHWMKKGYSEDESKKIISEKQRNTSKLNTKITPVTREVLKNKGMSDKEIDEFFKSRSQYSVKYYLNRGYTEDYATKQISRLQKKNSNKFKIKKQLNPNNYDSITETQLGYWIKKGYSEEDAKRKRSERQRTFSLKKCIEKYGKENGQIIFTNRQYKWRNSLTKNGNLKIGYSKISQELFYILLNEYDINDRKNIHFATHNGEFKINKESGGVWLYDFTDTKNMKIIEYNGDGYHANPKKYSNKDKPHPFRKDITAEDIWRKDELKLNVAATSGFNVLTIWDSEYRWGDKKNIVKKCLNFLLD